jgi:hypothetical protein
LGNLSSELLEAAKKLTPIRHIGIKKTKLILTPANVGSPSPEEATLESPSTEEATLESPSPEEATLESPSPEEATLESES